LLEEAVVRKNERKIKIVNTCPPIYVAGGFQLTAAESEVYEIETLFQTVSLVYKSEG